MLLKRMEENKVKLQLKERLIKDYFNVNNDRKDPDTEFRDFCTLLKTLINDKDIKDEQTIKIAKKLIENGPNTLSENQWDIFYRFGIGQNFYVGKCLICDDDIPWGEMFEASTTSLDQLCTTCRLADE